MAQARELTEDQSLLSAQVNGDSYLVCSERCRMLFSIGPRRFLARTKPGPARRAS